jgi:hypothetical protein
VRLCASLPAITTFMLVFAALPLRADDATPIPAHGVIGVEEAQLTPEFWIARQAHADEVILDAAAIAAQNARLLQLDPSMHDLRELPETIERARIAEWIADRSSRPGGPLFDVNGRPVDGETLDAVLANVAAGSIAALTRPRLGLVVQRAALRRFPTHLRAFDTRGNTDIDRFQESELFPGMPVAIVHESRDGYWYFVVSPRYIAWIEKRLVAEGPASQVLDYLERTPYRIITGAVERTVYTREQPELSQLQLDMGVRLPLATRARPDAPVNGQHPYAAHVLDLPLRTNDGALRFAPALLQKNADSSATYLPLTRANVIRQAFKFLGERYGWGHSYDARDCSGFVSDVYRSMGVEMPRNTSDQAASPALNRRTFSDSDDAATRERAARALDVGDLVYIPGHVMMVIGTIDGAPYVIHDTTGLTYRKPDGRLTRINLNEVSVSPLLPLLFDGRKSYVERMTSIVRIRP